MSQDELDRLPEIVEDQKNGSEDTSALHLAISLSFKSQQLIDSIEA